MCLIEFVFMPSIKILSDATINKIAAGEVIENAASVVKELLENSIDAGASRISVEIENGGYNLIRISDDGCGISKQDLEVAVVRHATSKLPDEDVLHPNYMGFRGEALPSVGSVSKLKIISKAKSADGAYSISVENNLAGGVEAASYHHGTCVEVRDLFCFTPARLKFIKSTRSESTAISTLVKRYAISFPDRGFRLIIDGRKVFDLQASEEPDRLQEVLGKEFMHNSKEFAKAGEYIRVHGFCCIPTYTRSTRGHQYVYLNNRFINDKYVLHAIKSAYDDLIPGGRYPVIVLKMEVDNRYVDVNVHPAKMEVRFRNVSEVRRVIIAAIRDAITNTGTSSAMKEDFISTLIKASGEDSRAIDTSAPEDKVANYEHDNSARADRHKLMSRQPNIDILSDVVGYKAPNVGSKSISNTDFAPNATAANPAAATAQTAANDSNTADAEADAGSNQGSTASTMEEEKKQEASDVGTEVPPLGFAQFQLMDTYIISKSGDSLVIVDQHAAHERITLEKMKKADALNVSQHLLNHVIDATEEVVNTLIEPDNKAILAEYGILYEKNGPSQLLVRSIPTTLLKEDIGSLMTDIALELVEVMDTSSLRNKLNRIMADVACHNSIRAGKTMNIEQMNALLRMIESEEFTSQCNHGRPTYTKISISELGKIFERT